MPRIETVGEGRYRVGESPAWDARQGALYWVDVASASVHRHQPATGASRQWHVGGTYLGAMALRADGNAVLAMDDGFHFLDLATGSVEAAALPEANSPDTVFNDAKVDPCGRFVAGSTHKQFQQPLGAWYLLRSDGTWSRLAQGIVCCNGPCWSPDGRTFYYADSVRRTIYACDYDLDRGAMGPPVPFASTEAWNANPDGATVDAEGYLWSALFNGGRVVRFAPDGTLDREVELPARFTSSVAFGGEHLDVLYVTSIGDAIMGLADPSPQAGCVFAIHDLGVVGRPEPLFGGPAVASSTASPDAST